MRSDPDQTGVPFMAGVAVAYLLLVLVGAGLALVAHLFFH